MEREEILKILADMRKEGRIVDVALSAYINMKLRGGEIEDIYQLLDSDNMIIILRSVASQTSKFKIQEKLKFPEYDAIVKEKGLDKETIIKLFKLAMENETYTTFIDVCNILHKELTEQKKRD